MTNDEDIWANDWSFVRNIIVFSISQLPPVFNRFLAEGGVFLFGESIRYFLFGVALMGRQARTLI